MKIIDLYLFLLKKSRFYKISEFNIRHLISFYQKKDPFLSFYLESNLEAKHVKKIKNIFEKIKSAPLEYILKETFFFGNKYFVNKNVLIPRLETEELIQLAIIKIKEYIEKHFKGRKINILDVGTGSGVIAIEIKKIFFDCAVDGSDISKKALKVAKINARKFNVDVCFYKTDVFPNKKYNVVLSNPPYIKNKKNISKSVLYEPSKALFINEKNNVYKKILKNIEKKIILPALLIFEISEEIVLMLRNFLSLYL